ILNQSNATETAVAAAQKGLHGKLHLNPFGMQPCCAIWPQLRNRCLCTGLSDRRPENRLRTGRGKRPGRTWIHVAFGYRHLFHERRRGPNCELRVPRGWRLCHNHFGVSSWHQLRGEGGGRGEPPRRDLDFGEKYHDYSSLSTGRADLIQPSRPEYPHGCLKRLPPRLMTVLTEPLPHETNASRRAAP